MKKKLHLEDLIVQLTIISLPFGVISIGSGVFNLSIPNLLLLGSIMYLGIFKYSHKNINITVEQLGVLCLLSVILATIALSTAINPGSLSRFITYVGYLLMVAVVFLYTDSKRDIQRILHMAYISAIIISILTIFHSITYPTGLPFGQEYLGSRTVARVRIPFQRTLGIPGIHYGVFGMIVLSATPYYFYLCLNNRSLIILSSLLPILFAILIIQSRSTWIATIVSLLIVAMGYAFKEYDLKHVLALFSVLISPLVLTLPRIAEVLVSVQSGSVSARILQYKEAIRLIELHPILGVGPGNISQYYSTFAIHSEFLRIGAESGIVAFLSMISLWMSGVLYSIRNALTSEEKYGLAVGLIGSLSVMMIEGNLAPGLPWAPWVVLSLIFSLHQVE